MRTRHYAHAAPKDDGVLDRGILGDELLKIGRAHV